VTGRLVSAVGQRFLAVLLAAEPLPPAQRADTRQMLVWLLIAGVVIAVVSVVLVVANRIARRWRYNSHPALFYRLCKIHGMDSASRRLLKRVVRFHRLRHPGRLFVEPNWLDPANLGTAFRPYATELERLRNALFNVRPRATDSQ
jgi:hypothetical protein